MQDWFCGSEHHTELTGSGSYIIECRNCREWFKSDAAFQQHFPVREVGLVSLPFPSSA